MVCPCTDGLLDLTEVFTTLKRQDEMKCTGNVGGTVAINPDTNPEWVGQVERTGLGELEISWELVPTIYQEAPGYWRLRELKLTKAILRALQIKFDILSRRALSWVCFRLIWKCHEVVARFFAFSRGLCIVCDYFDHAWHWMIVTL